MRKTFTWILSLMIFLTAFATLGYAQEEQETVELYAEDASFCFNEGNDYTVTVSVRDFIQLNSMELALGYNPAVYTFAGATDAITSLSGITATETTSGQVDIKWDGTPVTIGDDVKTDILVLHFTLNGFPGNTSEPPVVDLEWTTSDFWYDADGTQDLVNTVTAQDGSLEVNVSLTGIETSLTSEDCFGGDVTLTVTSPAAADSFLFNGGTDANSWTWTNSPVYLAAAGETVSVRVKDASGCISLRKIVEIPESIDPVSFSVEKEDAECFGGKGSVIISATGGTGPYTYYISTDSADVNATMKSNFQFSMAPGTYWVWVKDANECTTDLAWQEITINDDNDPINVVGVPTDVLCYGAKTGEIEISVTPIGAYELSIDGGATWGATIDGDSTFVNLAAGTYKVMARNVNGCVVTSDNIVVDEPESPITFDVVIDDAECGNSDGQITVTDVDGGAGSYTYSLTKTGTYSNSPVFASLSPNYYSMYVKDGNGCIAEYENPNLTGNVIAVQAPEAIKFEVEITDPLCMGEAAKVEIINVTGGNDGLYKYSFDGGTTWVDTVTASWPSPYSTMTISVDNATGATCTISQSIDSDDVGGPTEALTAYIDNAATLAPTCIDGNDGNIHLIIEGGTAPYYYSVNGGSWKETNDMLTIVKVNVGEHEILVKDANNCEISAPLNETVTLDENDITALSDGNIACYGEKIGTISVNFTSWAEGLVSGVPSPRSVQYMVRNLDGTNASAFNPSNRTADPTKITTFNAGTYVVSVVDQYGCESNTDTVEITQTPMLKIDDVVANGASCYNTFEGTITVHASGGNIKTSLGTLEYAVVNKEAALDNIAESKWLPFETYVDSTTLSTVSFQVDGGTYWIAVRDECDKELTYGPIEVDGYAELLVDEDDVVSTDPLCYKDSSGTITVPMGAVTGGAGAYLFTLLDASDDEIDGYVDLTTGEFNGLPAGTYSVLVEDAEDCPSYTTAQITLINPDSLYFTTEYKHMSCENTNDGLITVNVNGGTGDYWYAINNMKTWIAFKADTSTKTYIATEPGTFKVWVKDENGCIAGPDTITILEPTPLSADITVVDSVSCYGGNDAEISVEGIGGWEDITTYTFSVDSGAWSSAVAADIPVSFTDLDAGEHILYIKDATNYDANDTLQALDCQYEVTFVIGEPEPITYDVMITDVKCKDGADGTFTVEILSGGVPFDLTGTADDGFDVRLTGSGFDSGLIRTGADNTHTFEGLDHSIYTLYITDAKGCTLPASVNDAEGPYTTEESWEIAEPDSMLTLNPEWTKDAMCYGSEDGQFLALASGGTPPYKYYAGLSVVPDGHILIPTPPAADSDEWQVSDTFNVSAGTWVVWVMDENGCIVGGEKENGVAVNKWRVKVEQPDSIQWEFATEEGSVVYAQPKCYGSWTGQIYIADNDTSIIGGSGVYNAHVMGISAFGESVDLTYASIEVDGTLPYYVLDSVPGSDSTGYAVTITDGLGCVSAYDTIFVGQPEELTVSLIKGEGEFSCAGVVEGNIEAVAEGGTGDYEYQLLKNGVVHTAWQGLGSSFLVQVGNEFIIQVRDENGCMTQDTMALDTIAEVVIVSVDDRSCFGDETPTAVVNATAEDDRAMEIRYQKVSGEGSDDLGPWSEWMPFNEEDGMGTHKMSEGLTYGDNNEVDGHYHFQVRDEMGCESDIELITFVPVQTQIEVTADVDGTTITATAEAGAVDSELNHHYEYALRAAADDSTELVWQAENVLVADGIYGELVVYARDYHKCFATDTVMVEMPVTAIADVQSMKDTSDYVGEVVKIEGTVSAVATGGFFVQDDNATWSGIWIAADDAVEIGDGVTVVGTVDEIGGVTAMTEVTVTVGTATLAVEPVEVLPEDVEDEMYESVLVYVHGVRANAMDTTGMWTAYTEEDVMVTVNDWIYSSEPVEGNFYDVTGIAHVMDTLVYIEPRMESDVVDLTATPVIPIEEETVEFSIYPNPFSNEITISNNDKLTRVIISNIAGQRVIDVEYPGSTITTAKLVSGVYLVRLFTEEGNTRTETMIKR